jgi:glucose-1-phosphate thymidylyltransferase
MTKLVGLIPAGGLGNRLAPLPGSKELFPIGFMPVSINGQTERRPKPICMYVIESMRAAGVEQLLMVINTEKIDILRYLRGGSQQGLSVSYLVQENAWGMPYALNLASPWVRDATVLFGMPDTLFQPADAFQLLLSRHQASAADLTLGLFPTTKPERFGMVAFDHNDRMLHTVDKPAQSDLSFMWGIACWQPTFTSFMSEYLGHLQRPVKEVVLGDIFQAALQAQLNIGVVPFSDGEYIDIGNPEELVSSVNRFGQL